MKYRTFGRTGWQISEIGFGAWAIGSDWGQVDERQAIDTLQAAIDQGVNFIDTADVYGDGRSERLIAKALKGEGLDFVGISSGGITADTRTPTTPGYNVPIAARVKKEAGIATRTVGLITTPEQAEQIVAQGEADMVSLARAFLDDPHWGWHAGKALGTEVARPRQYARAGPKLWAPAKA